jgi:hypothetical protein
MTEAWRTIAIGLLLVAAGAYHLERRVLSPLVDARAAASWNEARCTVEESELTRRRDSDNGYRYRVDLAYAYEVDGARYRSARWTFERRETSRRESAQRILDEHPVGAIVPCWYDPDRPAAAVLDRDVRGVSAIALVPLAILLLGLYLVEEQLRKHVLRRTRVRRRAAPDGRVELVRSDGSAVGLVAIAAMALGFGAAAATVAPGASAGGSIVTAVALVLGAVSLGLTIWLVWLLLRRLGTRVTVRVDEAELRTGAPMTLRWSVRCLTRVRSLRVRLVGREEVVYSDYDPQDRATVIGEESEDFFDEIIAAAEAGAARLGGDAVVELPADAMHTFHAPHNKVVWLVTIDADVAWWPDIAATFELPVRPGEVRA